MLWQIISAIELLLSKYKKFSEKYNSLALSIESSKVENLNINITIF